MNASFEDYMRSIYSLYEKNDDKSLGIKAVDIANLLGVSKPSVSSMVKKLANEGYLRADPYARIFLTEKGVLEAKKIVHKHRVIEVFLKDVLGYSDMMGVHDEANNLEHAFSDESIKRLDRFLNNPQVSPSGLGIPHKGHDGVPVWNTLDMLDNGAVAKIVKVRGKGNLFRRLLDMGVVRGTEVKVIGVAPLGDPIDVRIMGYDLTLRKSEAKNIEVVVE